MPSLLIVRLKHEVDAERFVRVIYDWRLARVVDDEDQIIDELYWNRVSIKNLVDRLSDLQSGRISPEARILMKRFPDAEKDSLGVRVSVKTGGCAGMSYVMEYTKEINPNDEVIDDKGVKVFVDSAAIMYLLGTEMDYKKEELSSSFVFNNPNETERCGCGESFKIE